MKKSEIKMRWKWDKNWEKSNNENSDNNSIIEDNEYGYHWVILSIDCIIISKEIAYINKEYSNCELLLIRTALSSSIRE